jgi:nucleotide-binding universal stress UspA family protein
MTYQKNKIIMVPFDFSEISENALDYAGKLARVFKYSVTIINILTSDSKEYLAKNKMDINQQDDYLKKLAKKKSYQHIIDVHYVNNQGDINTISSEAKKIGANFIVIGIDKPKKTSSKLLQVIGDAPVPSFVVQQKFDNPTFRNIIFPVDLTDKTRQKTGWTIRVAQLAKSKVHLFAIGVTEQFQRTHQVATLKMIEKEFTDYGVTFETSSAKGKQKDFPEELMNFAKSKYGDLFVVMKTPTTYFSTLFYSPADLKIIMNELKVPCLCINPRDTGKTVVGL